VRAKGEVAEASPFVVPQERCPTCEMVAQDPRLLPEAGGPALFNGHFHDVRHDAFHFQAQALRNDNFGSDLVRAPAQAEEI
jgi:hypothetical protein